MVFNQSNHEPVERKSNTKKHDVERVFSIKGTMSVRAKVD